MPFFKFFRIHRINRAAFAFPAATALAALLLPSSLHSSEVRAAQKAGRATFTNPVSRNAADPWIVCENGYYYMTSTRGWGVAVRRSPTLAGLSSAKDVPVWHGGGAGYEAFTRDVWAPELHFLRNKWYVYYTATDGPDENRRVFVLEAQTDDPQGRYTFKGKLAVPDKNDDEYAIDGTVWERPKDKALFALWSGRDKAIGRIQNIYLAPMSNPWTVSGARVRLSMPTFAWESTVGRSTRGRSFDPQRQNVRGIFGFRWHNPQLLLRAFNQYRRRFIAGGFVDEIANPGFR